MTHEEGGERLARAKVDFQIVNHGTIYLLYPHTRRAKRWVKYNLPQDHMKYADALIVEHGHIDDIIDGIAMYGLEIAISKVQLPS